MVGSVSSTNALVCTEEVTEDMEEDMGKSPHQCLVQADPVSRMDPR